MLMHEKIESRLQITLSGCPLKPYVCVILWSIMIVAHPHWDRVEVASMMERACMQGNSLHVYCVL